MADRPSPLHDRPVLVGLAALLSVAVVVGLLAGGVVLIGSRILGVGEVEASADTDPSAGSSLYLPEPEKTTAPSGPRITLNVDPEEQDEEEEPEPEKEKKAEKKIVLEAGQSSASAMSRIDLRGTYASGEGAILQVQRKEGGSWTDFPVTVSVRNGTYSTYVVTGRVGKTKFRVVDTDSDKKSNAVTVEIG